MCRFLINALSGVNTLIGISGSIISEQA